MRVKLSYTVEEDTVLAEAAKIVGLCASDVQHAVTLFNEVQKQLTGEDEDDGPPNTAHSIEMLEEFRHALLNIDTRLFEVQEIVEGYEKYLQEKRPSSASVDDTARQLPTEASALLQE
jgi:hypothetical protein